MRAREKLCYVDRESGSCTDGLDDWTGLPVTPAPPLEYIRRSLLDRVTFHSFLSHRFLVVVDHFDDLKALYAFIHPQAVNLKAIPTYMHNDGPKRSCQQKRTQFYKLYNNKYNALII